VAKTRNKHRQPKEETMRKLIKKINTFIDKLLHRYCGTPKCCGKCSKAGSYIHKESKHCPDE
jgi:bacterioferritin-associated ferredoxin